MLIAVTDLPEPDSPTIANTSPRLTSKRDAVDRLDFAVVGVEADLEVADREQDLRSRTALQLRVERVAQAVAHEDEREHGEEDRHAREEEQVRRSWRCRPCLGRP